MIREVRDINSEALIVVKELYAFVIIYIYIYATPKEI